MNLLVNIVFKRANMYMLLIKNEVVAFIYLVNIIVKDLFYI